MRLSLTQHKFDADSGRPLINDTAMPWRTYNFDYSDKKQLKVGEGPIPEGNYHILKDKVQIWDNLSIGQQLKASIGRGQWPGGEYSWGAYRFEIYPKSVNLSGGVVRGDFFVHGGDIPGSAGCIDLCGGINRLYSKLIQNQQNKVHLLVMYK